MFSQLIKIGESLYQVKRVIPFNESINVQSWKEHVSASHSFKKDNLLYFVDEVIPLEFENINQEYESTNTP